MSSESRSTRSKPPDQAVLGAAGVASVGVEAGDAGVADVGVADAGAVEAGSAARTSARAVVTSMARAPGSR